MQDSPILYIACVFIPIFLVGIGAIAANLLKDHEACKPKPKPKKDK